MQKSKIITVLVIVVIILVAVVFSLLGSRKTLAPVADVENNKIQTEVKPEILGYKDDLLSFSITPGSKVSGLTKVQGVIKGGYFFEGNIILKILEGSDKKVVLETSASAVTDWMTAGPVSFEGVLDFSSFNSGPAFIEIHNDNASGIPENDKSILIPITIQ